VNLCVLIERIGVKYELIATDFVLGIEKAAVTLSLRESTLELAKIKARIEVKQRGKHKLRRRGGTVRAKWCMTKKQIVCRKTGDNRRLLRWRNGCVSPNRCHHGLP